MPAEEGKGGLKCPCDTKTWCCCFHCFPKYVREQSLGAHACWCFGISFVFLALATAFSIAVGANSEVYGTPFEYTDFVVVFVLCVFFACVFVSMLCCSLYIFSCVPAERGNQRLCV